MNRFNFILIILFASSLFIACEKNPIQEQLEITNDHACWLSNSNTLALYDLNGQILLSYTDLSYTADLAVYGNTRDLWAARPATGQIVKYSATGQLIRTINGFVLPTSISINYDNGEIWIADKLLGQVIVLDQYGNEIARISGFVSPTSVSICSVDNSAWVADPGTGKVYHILYYNLLHQVVFPENINVNLVAGNQADGTCWVYHEDTHGNGMLTKLSASEQPIMTVTGIKSPRSMDVSFNTDDSTLWVADSDNNRILKLSSDGQILTIINGYTNPSDISVDQSDGSCWACLMGNNLLAHFDKDGNLLLETSTVPVAPLQVAAMPVLSP